MISIKSVTVFAVFIGCFASSSPDGFGEDMSAAGFRDFWKDTYETLSKRDYRTLQTITHEKFLVVDVQFQIGHISALTAILQNILRNHPSPDELCLADQLASWAVEKVLSKTKKDDPCFARALVPLVHIAGVIKEERSDRANAIAMYEREIVLAQICDEAGSLDCHTRLAALYAKQGLREQHLHEQKIIETIAKDKHVEKVSVPDWGNILNPGLPQTIAP